MTAYVFGASSSTQTCVSIAPVSFETRIAQVVMSGQDGNTSGDLAPYIATCYVSYYTGGTSGGTSGTPAPLREGAPASTAVAKGGVSITGVGTAVPVYAQSASGPSLTLQTGGSLPDYVSSFSATFQPPFDLILSPGSALLVEVQFGSSAGFIDVFVFFEELRLSWPY
jgi:hypothetical protein